MATLTSRAAARTLCKEGTYPDAEVRSYREVERSDGRIRASFQFVIPGGGSVWRNITLPEGETVLFATLRAIEFPGLPEADEFIEDEDLEFDFEPSEVNELLPLKRPVAVKHSRWTDSATGQERVTADIAYVYHKDESLPEG